jgi:LPS-assembly protein
MRRPGTLLTLALGVFVLARAPAAEQKPAEPDTLIIQSLRGEAGEAQYDFATGIASATNGVMIRYHGAVLTAEGAAWHEATKQVEADGDVRIQQGDQVWTGQHLRYNFETRQIEAAQFRTGEPPFFAAGRGLNADITNQVYVASGALLTSDDIAHPAIKVRAKRIKIIPGKRIEATHATLYYGEIPVFYFPYYTRNIGEHPNNWTVLPGYRSLFGPFALGSYTWYYNDHLDGIFHLDYRGTRGPGVGPDLNYHFGRWGEGTLRYYYTHDQDPEADQLGVPISENRQRVWLSYQANPATNLFLKGLLRYESDLAVVRDFFEGEYRRNPQPDTFFEANKFWQNFSLDAYVQPRVNYFLETVERLPDIRLTGYRQQVGPTPFYYESETSAGYYRRAFAEDTGVLGPPPGLNYEAARADTYHQLLLPQTLFGWLNVTPRAGGRFTAYSEASGPGATTVEENRGVFNTGAEVSFKASRLWPTVKSAAFEMDGLRHIVEPSANYVYVPSPSVAPAQLPQFDYELPSLRQLPIEFPDYNAIDSIDSQNVIRWGLHNKLQTKRNGQVVNLVNWDLSLDWRLNPSSDQTTFGDIYSDLVLKPRSWLTLESITRYALDPGYWRLAYNTMTISPNDTWAWRIGHFYLRDDPTPPPTGLGTGNDIISSSLTFRVNENWGLRASHYFDVRQGALQEQVYTVYRDLRSWTAALSFLIRHPSPGSVTTSEEYTVAFTFSLKAYPRFKLGADSGGPYSLLGG